MKRLELVHVECYSGYRANEAPRAFVWKGKRYQIVEIRDRWYEGGMSGKSISLDYYRVLAAVLACEGCDSVPSLAQAQREHHWAISSIYAR
jgi:hypothetical protein